MNNEYENRTESAVVNTQPNELPVPTFSKKEVEKIVDEKLKKKWSLDLSDYDDVDLTKQPGIDLEKAYEGRDQELTPEILAFFKHSLERGVASWGGYVAFLNYAMFEEDRLSLCFGCTRNNDFTGFHIDIDIRIYENLFAVQVSEM